MSRTQKSMVRNIEQKEFPYLLLFYSFFSWGVRIQLLFLYQKGNNLPNKCFIVAYLPKYWMGNRKEHESVENNGLNRLLSFSLFFLFRVEFPFWSWNFCSREQRADDDELHAIQIYQGEWKLSRFNGIASQTYSFVLLSFSRLRLVKRVPFYICDKHFSGISCFCYNPECWMLIDKFSSKLPLNNAHITRIY